MMIPLHIPSFCCTFWMDFNEMAGRLVVVDKSEEKIMSSDNIEIYHDSFEHLMAMRSRTFSRSGNDRTRQEGDERPLRRRRPGRADDSRR